jgi:chaperone LolA
MSRFILALSLALTLTAAAQELTADEQKVLIEKLQSQRTKQPAMTAEFTEQRTTRLVNKPIVSSGTIAFQAPDKFRREVKGSSPSLAVCNGRELWIYYPAFNEAERYTLGQRQIFDDSLAALTAGLNFEGVEKYFRISASKDGAGYSVSLVPKSSGLKKYITTLEVFIEADGTVKKTDATLPKGDRVVTTYRDAKSAKQSDAKFDFTPPAGVNVTTPLGK